MTYYLGIDTSCYTTSCAIVDEEGRLVQEVRKLLEVPQGKRGLQQSQMVFQHTRALGELIQSLHLDQPISAIGVSGFPRREEDSYHWDIVYKFLYMYFLIKRIIYGQPYVKLVKFQKVPF